MRRGPAGRLPGGLCALKELHERIEALYGAMASLLGLRLRERFTLHDCFVAEDSLGEGCGLRHRVDAGARQVILLPSGPDREEQERTIFAVGPEAPTRPFFEFDPGWTPGGRGQDGDRDSRA